MNCCETTVVIPVYNREKYIERAIRSVLSQTLSAREIIVVDDCSSDGTVERVRAFGPAVRLIELNAPSGGPATPRNVGIEAAASKYITLLDSDDYFDLSLLEKHSRLLELYPVVGLIVGNCYRRAYDSEHLAMNDPCLVRSCEKEEAEPGYYYLETEEAYRVLCLGNYITSATGTTFRKSDWRSVNGFDASLTTSQDRAFFFKLLRSVSLGYIDEPLFVYFHHDQNISAANRTLRFKPTINENSIRVLRAELEWTKSAENRRMLSNAICRTLLELAYLYRRHGYFGSSVATYLRSLRAGAGVKTVMLSLAMLPIMFSRDRLRAIVAKQAERPSQSNSSSLTQ